MFKFTEKVRRTFNKGRKTEEQKEKIQKEPLSIDESQKTESFQDKIKELEHELAQVKVENHMLVEENKDMEIVIRNLKNDQEMDTGRKRRKKAAETTEGVPTPAPPVQTHRDYPGQRKKTRPKGDWLTASRHARLLRTKDLKESIQQFAGKLEICQAQGQIQIQSRSIPDLF